VSAVRSLNPLLPLILTFAACGGATALPTPTAEDCTVTLDAGGSLEASPDASPEVLSVPPDASDLDSAPDAPCDAGPRYVITGEEAFDRTTGLTWYRRFLYGSASVPAPDICDNPFGVAAPMRRATVAESIAILAIQPNGEVQFDDPFYWSNAISSQASDGCINILPFSVTDECQGDLINRLCVR